MKIHYLQHAHFEGLGFIEEWIKSREAAVACTKLYDGETLPGTDEFDWLIVMGGPMGVYDEHIHPWLKDEKVFIKSAINSGKIVIGICLGAQLIASAMGQKVFPNVKKEIGWLNIKKAAGAENEKILKNLPESFPVFQWHGDTFKLPDGARLLFESEICKNQAFIVNDKALALQFHLEATPKTLDAMVENCGDELIQDTYISTKEEILNGAHLCGVTNLYMSEILNYFSKI
jgi:GMP synthase (glutamine-hydrolysing)